ncbi:hypothetical protein CYY_001914 [Polysphondylium violaceum]|uniref:GATA-type domain-containing protein n=1 Tax=Polysphondylium violaceum TaxID=133409 RepID=A0A8J4PXK6_9MYCE|nr:hypothetical protein CYY_001914 [Polysphondylium violaceum]
MMGESFHTHNHNHHQQQQQQQQQQFQQQQSTTTTTTPTTNTINNTNTTINNNNNINNNNTSSTSSIIDSITNKSTINHSSPQSQNNLINTNTNNHNNTNNNNNIKNYNSKDSLLLKIPLDLDFNPIEIDKKTESNLKHLINSNNSNIVLNNNFFNNNNNNNSSSNNNLNNNNNNSNNNNTKKPKEDKFSTSSTTMRVCEFCGSTATPTWRRGPSGKGSLCNACGIKWRLKGKDGVYKPPSQKQQNRQKQNQQQNSQQIQKQMQQGHSQQQQQQQQPLPQQQQQQQMPYNQQIINQHLKQLKQQHQQQTSQQNFQQFQQQIQQPNQFLPSFSSHQQSLQQKSQPQQILQQQQMEDPLSDDYNKKRKHDIMAPSFMDPLGTDFEKDYYCKYCKKTWPQSSFRNSQQFGAHCSNCSRKPKGELENMLTFKKKLSKKNSKDNLFIFNEEDGAVPLWDTMSKMKNTFSKVDKNIKNAPLLQRLIYVVENQLLEPVEIDSIREDIDNMKNDLLYKKKRRIEQLGDIKQKVNEQSSMTKLNIENNLKKRESINKNFIQDLRNEMDQRLSEHENIFFTNDSSHTVPAQNNSQPQMSKKVIPLSPELIHSPHHFSLPSGKQLYRDEQGKHFSIDDSNNLPISIIRSTPVRSPVSQS